ncbi:unnamed protein product [Rotaria sp. Silwood1]|nr:unnamed protein product [Rotaria sp. Silwood1]
MVKQHQSLVKTLIDKFFKNPIKYYGGKYNSIACDTSNYTVIQTTLYHTIETYLHTLPVSKFYFSNSATNSEIRLFIKILLDAGLVRQYQSDYVASALLVKKEKS